MPICAKSLRLCLFLSALFFAVWPVAGRGEDTNTLDESVKAVADLPANGAVDPHKAMITRRTLKAAEVAAPLEFEVNLRMRNLAELEARVAKGERISQKEMAARYEPLAGNYDATVNWLANSGFIITQRDTHHMAIFAKASVGQIQQGLGVTFARVVFDGKEYSSAITAPHVPAGLSPALVGINGLQPHLHAHKHLVRPNAIDGSAATYTPAQIAAAYSASGLYTSGLNGAGQSIAIVIDTFPDPEDLITFWKDAGVSQSMNNIQFVQAVPGTLDAPSGEETLDTEWSSGMAPGANVRVYAALDLGNAHLDEAYKRVYDDVIAYPNLAINQMSMSFGEGESFTTKAQVDTDDQYFVELAAAGVSIFASSGDEGSTPDGNGGDEGPLQPESPASDPNLTSVGGTTLMLTKTNTVRSETVWNDDEGDASGGGASIYFARPAWQAGTGAISGTSREVPDVSAAADPNYGALVVQGGTKQTIGGTSWSTPTWAGLCAVMNQARADDGENTLGLLGPQIYKLINSANYSTIYATNFRDITSGNNATSFSGGRYNAGGGYDLCTGIGSPLTQPLTKYLTGESTLIGIQPPGKVAEAVPGQTVTLTVNATGGTFTYQWQEMPIGSMVWSNLADDGTFSGSATATLSIAPASEAMSGDQFQCLVTTGGNTITVPPATTLIVEEPVTVAKLAGQTGVNGLQNGGPNTAQFNFPGGVAVDGSGNVYVADYDNNQIREVAPNGVVSTPYGALAGTAGYRNDPGNSALFNLPNAVAISPAGNIYVADSGNNVIRKISGGLVTTLAGGFNSPEGVAVDADENVYVADSGNNVIKKVTPARVVTIIAGRLAKTGFADGAAAVAEFNFPNSVAVDSLGNVFVADIGNSVVREVAGGQVTTIAGQPQTNGYLDATGTNALFDAPFGVAADNAGNVYVADSQNSSETSSFQGNCLLRRISPAGVVSTLAGNPFIAGSVNGSGTVAEFDDLQAVAQSASGEFFMADSVNQTIRSGTQSLTISAGGEGATIALSGSLAFGDVEVGTTSTAVMTITNNGNATLNVSGISFPAGFSGDFSSGGVGPGGSQVVNVSFEPTVDGTYGGQINVSCDALAGNPVINVSGVGAPPPPPPTVVDEAPALLTDSSATLEASVNPNGSDTQVYFEYGSDTTYGTTTASQDIGTGTSSVDVSEPIGGLMPFTPYHYRAVAESGTNVVFGSDVEFTTPSFAVTESVMSGDAAADVTGGFFATFGNPAINAVDDIAFQATLALGNGITARTNSGIWAQDDTATLHLVAKTGSSAVGTSAVYSSFSSPVYNDSEGVAFLGNLSVVAGEATGLTSQGIWSSSSGTLSLVARRGTQAPGYPTGTLFTAFQELALTDSSCVVFSGIVNARTGNRGVWAGNSAADLQLLAKTGDFVGGNAITALTFLPTVSFVNGQSRNVPLTGGTLACLATFGKAGPGILEIAGTNLITYQMAHQSAAGTSGAVYAALGNPIINNNGYVAYRATLTPRIGDAVASNAVGIWAQDNTGTLQLIARTSGTAAGTSGFFGTLDDPVFNDSEDVAFRGTLTVRAGQATGLTTTGIWASTSGTVSLIARQGSQAPGCATGVTFAGFSSVGIADQGGVIFLGTLNVNRALGVTAANNQAIWAMNSKGVLEVVARKGDVRNGKTITALSFFPLMPYVGGMTRDISPAVGDIAYQATFSDRTTGIFVVTFQ
jgi:kumamolisin